VSTKNVRSKYFTKPFSNLMDGLIPARTLSGRVGCKGGVHYVDSSLLFRMEEGEEKMNLKVGGVSGSPHGCEAGVWGEIFGVPMDLRCKSLGWA
jgi:hypothetical protein